MLEHHSIQIKFKYLQCVSTLGVQSKKMNSDLYNGMPVHLLR